MEGAFCVLAHVSVGQTLDNFILCNFFVSGSILKFSEINSLIAYKCKNKTFCFFFFEPSCSGRSSSSSAAASACAAAAAAA